MSGQGEMDEAVDESDSDDAESSEETPQHHALLCAVEVPGRVRDAQAAVAAIGGTTSVHHAMKTPKGRLKLRLCRDYKFQAPLPMKRKRTSDVLMKATRQADGTWHCIPQGVVSASFRTDTLADYIYAPGKELEHGGSAVIGSIEQEFTTQRVTGAPYMPPPFFTSIDKPQPYYFKDNKLLGSQAKQLKTNAVGTGEAVYTRQWVQVSVRRFKDEDMPSQPPAGAVEQLRDAEDEELVAVLKELFEERPIWLRAPLEERLESKLPTKPTISTLQKALICVAYFWADSPFRGCYLRLGYDPRLSADPAMHLQSMDFRDRYFRQQKVYFELLRGQALKSSSAAVSAAVDCHFRAPPRNRSQLYQFIDIEERTSSFRCMC
eukprot:TRINITY_DN23000_c0_g1_i6.p1 TRINITY_DN23000_c0_g1~~TRINITY_DN23000_c0_g1_i6.p1  ORF type:complete len:377 (-),score=72.47 TRINITY_DN23000_c0_g1_i6:107-1237(-)